MLIIGRYSEKKYIVTYIEKCHCFCTKNLEYTTLMGKKKLLQKRINKKKECDSQLLSIDNENGG